MPTIQVNGAQLAYVEQGQGDPLVFVHGSLGDFRSWDLQLESFAKQYRTIVYSRRYHYPNAWTGDGLDYSALLHAEDLAAFMTGLDLGRAHLVASSYGAYTALLLAVRHPQLVRALVLGEPPLMPWLEQSPEGQALWATFLADALAPARQACQKGELEQGVRLFIEGVIGKGAFDQLPPPARERMMDNALQLKAETAALDIYPTLTCEDARQITAPTLLLTGEWSPRMFHLITDELERCLPNCEHALISAASHAMHAGNPEVYNKTVLAFLARHSKAF